MLHGTSSDAWNEQYFAVEAVRRLCKFHPDIIVPHVYVLRVRLPTAKRWFCLIPQCVAWKLQLCIIFARCLRSSTVLKLVLDSANSVRSAVTRNALWCLADMFACIPDAMSLVIGEASIGCALRCGVAPAFGVLVVGTIPAHHLPLFFRCVQTLWWTSLLFVRATTRSSFVTLPQTR